MAKRDTVINSRFFINRRFWPKEGDTFTHWVIMPRMDAAHSLIHSLIHRSLYLQSVTKPSGHSLNGKSLNESPLWHNGYGLLYLPHPRHMVTESRMERLVMDTALKHVHKMGKEHSQRLWNWPLTAFDDRDRPRPETRSGLRDITLISSSASAHS